MDARIFADRREAGAALAQKLGRYGGRSDVLVMALPRGGVPVGYEVAQALGAPLDVLLVRKLGVPGHRELAMGAIASGGARVINDDLVSYLGIPASAIEDTAREEQVELDRRERTYREGRPAPRLEGRTVVLVDDGLATGSTMKAAAQAVRALRAARVVVAVPVGAPDTCSEMREVADEVVCARTPEPFRAVGEWYADFSQTEDGEVRELLGKEQSQQGLWGKNKAYG
jgi:predicted phosphoribosyltransferase